MATKKRTKSVKNEAQIREKAEEVRVAMEREAHLAYDRLVELAGPMIEADTIAQSEGLAFGKHLNEFMGEHADTIKKTLEDIAFDFGIGADKMRAMRLAASIRPFLKALGLDDVDSYSWARYVVSGLKEVNEKGDSRLVNADLFCSVDPSNVERDLPNTVRRLSLFADALRRHEPVKAARIAAQADRGDFETVADMEEAKAEAKADAAEAKSEKTPEQKVHERKASLYKACAEIEDDELLKELLKDIRSGATLKRIRALKAEA